MANEWTKVELYGANNDGNPVRYTIATGASVSKGELLELTDERTVVSATVNGPIAGVASEEHTTSDGTSISAWTNGLFRAVASGGITVGASLFPAGQNDKNTVSSAISTSWTGARALDTVTDGQTLTVRLNV